MERKKGYQKGFTLVELLVVIAIIAILAAIIAPNAFKAIEKSKVSKIVGDCKTIENATLQHYADTGTWPVFDNNGAGTTNNKGFLGVDGYKPNGWNGPYLERWPKNPFNSGAVESDENYQLDYRNMGSAGNNLVVEISLNGVANYDKIRDNLDKSIDGEDGLNSGKIQWVNNNRWITWIIVKNAEGVKKLDGSSFNAH